MKIGIDVRCLMNKNYTGVSHYTLNLLRAIFELDRENEYLLFYNSSKPVKMPEFNQPNVKYYGFHYPNKVFNFAVNFFNWPKIDRMIGGVDVFFAPNLHFVSWSKDCKKILAVHDLSFMRFPEFFSWKMRIWHKLVLWKKILNQADLILADSQNTKNDLIDLCGIKAEKIIVNFLGVGDEFKILEKNDSRLALVRVKYNLPEKFILYLGTLEPRKNIESIIEAYNLLSQKKILPLPEGELEGVGVENSGKPPLTPPWKGGDSSTSYSHKRDGGRETFSKNSSPFIRGRLGGGLDYDLVIAGADGWKTKNIYCLAKNNPRIKFIGYVEDRAALYNLAGLLVYPSYYEGFGLPLIEAMACGCPVIAGNNSSQGEVVGKAGLLVDPYNLNEIASAINLILWDENLRNDFINRGLARAREFSWQNTAKKFLDLISK